MRHEQIHIKDSFDTVDVAAVWPASTQVAPLPIPDIEGTAAQQTFRATAAAPDVPASVGSLIAASYAILVGAFALVTTGSKESIFAVAISALFVAIFFTVPRIFLSVEPRDGLRPTLNKFLDHGMETLTGHSSGGAALVQMLIVPVFLTFAVLTIGLLSAILL